MGGWDPRWRQLWPRRATKSRGFDLADGLDVRDAEAVRRAAHGVDLIVHAAGLADDRGGSAADIMSINLLGTWNVLLAAETEKISRVVYFSSGKSIGMLEREPDYLPMDDEHRGLPTRPYGLAKWLSEEMCAAFTKRTGIDTICLRPVAVFDEEGYAKAMNGPPRPSAPGAVWHLGVHVDLRDVATATVAAVNYDIPRPRSTAGLRGRHRRPQAHTRVGRRTSEACRLARWAGVCARPVSFPGRHQPHRASARISSTTSLAGVAPTTGSK